MQLQEKWHPIILVYPGKSKISILNRCYRIYTTRSFVYQGLGIEASSNMEVISFEEQNFLKLMDEKSRKVGEHFEIPFPLKGRPVKLPNNRNIAEKRLHCLKSRFIRNPEFFADYKGFIEDLLIKGYAKKSTEKPPDGQTWYILHHGVCHPNKPGIINCGNLVKGLQKWSW